VNPGTSYKPQEGFSLLLVGPPFSGKTSVAMQFPDPWIASTDRKIGNAIARIPKNKTWFYDYPELDPTGKPLLDHLKWARLIDLTKKAAVDPAVKTIVWDHMSDISDWLQAHIMATDGSGKTLAGIKVMSIALWQPFKLMMARALTLIKGAGKPFIVVAHDIVDKNDITGEVTCRPYIGGRLKDTLGGYFSDAWRCEVEPGFREKPAKYKVRTQPTAQQKVLGSSFGLPAEFEFSWDVLAKALEQ